MEFKFSPYQKRPIRFTGTRNYNGWNLKQYSISAYNDLAPQALFEAAAQRLNEILPQQAISDDRYGAGILIVHEGLDGNYIIVSWWVGENMLCHQILAAPASAPYDFKSFKDTGIVACVWELEILYFEKKRWSEYILMKAEQPDFENYLAEGFSGNI